MLVLVGNSQTLRRGCKVWKSLIHEIEQNGNLIEVNQEVNSTNCEEIVKNIIL